MNKTKIFIVLFLAIVLAGFILSKSKSSEKNNPDFPIRKSNTTKNISSNSFIESLRVRRFQGGKITVEETLSKNNSYTKYLISYPSDDLKIYGIMNVPQGNGPFPVILLNHGYFNASTYQSGDGTDGMANILAAKGYLTLASDYRGFGKSQDVPDQASRGHRPEYAIDVLNLIASVKSLPKADQNKIGMWGHSMGGEVALRTVEAIVTIKTLVLWAPTATRASDNRGFRAGRQIGGANPTSDTSQDGAAPMNYLRYIQTPISLHQGLSDTEVNPQGSKELNKALQKEGKQIEYFEYPGQDHNFKNLGWDIISQRTVDFFDKYLKGGDKR